MTSSIQLAVLLPNSILSLDPDFVTILSMFAKAFAGVKLKAEASPSTFPVSGAAVLSSILVGAEEAAESVQVWSHDQSKQKRTPRLLTKNVSEYFRGLDLCENCNRLGRIKDGLHIYLIIM